MYIKIKKEIINPLVCVTDSEIKKGMMGKDFTGFDGMLFLMGDGNHSFWMKNCIVPLDIIFIDSSFKITKIHHNCPPCNDIKCRNYLGFGKYVLELEGGRCKKNQIRVGDKCDFMFKLR
jgi:hypothetical protein